MRRGLGTVLIAVFVLAFSANVRAGENDYELTLRQGVPAKVILKGCHKLESIAVDFDGNGDPYQAQWWRCGSSNPNRKKGRFPINYILIQPPRGKAGRSAHAHKLGKLRRIFHRATAENHTGIRFPAAFAHFRPIL